MPGEIEATQSASQMVTLSHPPSGARVDVPADAVIAAMGAEVARLRGVDDELALVKRILADTSTDLGNLRTTVLEMAHAIDRCPSPDRQREYLGRLTEAAQP